MNYNDWYFSKYTHIDPSFYAFGEMAWQAAQAAAVQWQPIETAPKDGKELILLWVPAMGHGLMKWNGIWDDRVYNCDGPTHWMPLPSAPKPTEDV